MDADAVIGELNALRGSARDTSFWDRLCSAIMPLCRARSALVVAFETSSRTWEILGHDCHEDDWIERHLAEALGDSAERALKRGVAINFSSDASGKVRVVSAVRLTAGQMTLLLLDIPERERPHLNELLLRAQLAANVPGPGPTQIGLPSPKASSGTIRESAPRQVAGLEKLLDFLSLAALVMREERFGAAALVLVNGVSTQLGSTLVALGWVQGAYVQTVAISYLDHFERKTEHVRLLESAMEEAVDQERDLVYPDDRSHNWVVLAHGRLQQALGCARVYSIPLQTGTVRPQAVLLITEQKACLDSSDFQQLQIAIGLLFPWLVELRRRDRWWGKRMWEWTRWKLEALFGPDNAMQKAAAIGMAIVLLYLVFGSWDFRVKGGAQLVTDHTRIIGAPFDGYVDQVKATTGDVIRQGSVMATLDTQDLYMQESEIRADIRRFVGDADKARAANDLADMEIANARRSQAEARLARVLFYREQAVLRAPFDGVVVEGERKDLLGLPVRKGDAIFRLARIEGLFVAILLPEADIRYVTPGSMGQMALLSRPDEHIPFRVETIIPMAQVKAQEGNQFLIKGSLERSPDRWWRPGMSGTARIDVGRRHIIWILTHRLVDTLRMKLWW